MHNVILLTDYTDSLFLTKILGPYKVAHELRKLGIDAVVINHLHMWDVDELQKFVESLITEKTLFVGINNFYYKNTEGIDFYSNEHIVLNPSYHGQILPQGLAASEKFSKFIKDKGIPLVLGGPTALDRAHNKVFDYLLQGFTETSISNFVDHLIHGTALTESYKSIFGPTIVKDTNQQQNWDFSKSDMVWTDKDAILPGDCLDIEIARGCIFKCKFCSYPLIGKKNFDYIRHADVIKQELIDNWKNFGVTRYWFIDETLNDSVHKLQLIEKISSELPFKLEYFAYLRLDLIIKHPETIGMLCRSGLVATHFGIETFHPQAGKAAGKKFNPEKVKQILQSFKTLSNGRVNLHASFIVGLPYESKEHILQTHEMLKSKEMPLDSFIYFPLTIPKAGANRDSGFTENYEKYGFREMLSSDETKAYEDKFAGQMLWESPWMNCIEAAQLTQQLEQDSYTFKNVGGATAFAISSLGLDLDLYLNKAYSEVDWHVVTQQKRARFELYKTNLIAACKRNLDCSK